MSFVELIKTPNGRIVVSIILAFGLACMLRIACKNANMVIIKGPPIKDVEDKLFSFDNKCYSYKTVNTSCKNLENNTSD